jgi:hypothetical protein
MKKIYTLLLLFTLVGFLSGNQVVITNDYQYIITTEETYNFTDGDESNNVKYDRTNKIAIQNNKVLADPLKYHYAFFWDEADTFIGYYKTNKGITTSGAYLGEVNTQSIPLPLNAYSFALVRYDNDYVVVSGLTLKNIFIDSDNYFTNSIDWTTLNNLTLNELFINNNLVLNGDFNNSSVWSAEVLATWDSFNINDSFFVGFSQNTAALRFPRVQQVKSYTASDSIYTYIRDYQSTMLAFSTVIFDPLTTTITNFLTGLENQTIAFQSSIVSIAATGTGFLRFNNATNNPLSLLTVDEIGQINLTSLSLTALTKTNLDNYYNLHRNVIENNFTYSGYSTIFINPTYAYDEKILNLTAIFGATNEPIEATMDGYYDAYEEYLEYSFILPLAFNGQTISFETIYFDDGVSTEIERLGSILIFTLIGFTLMIFGFASKRRIFNLLAVGAFVVLGFLLIEFVGFIIILFGLIFVNVYYTFFGEL